MENLETNAFIMTLNDGKEGYSIHINKKEFKKLANLLNSMLQENHIESKLITTKNN